MNNTVAQATELIEGLKASVGNVQDVEVVVCPTFTALASVGAQIQGTSIGLGAQNMHFEASGAYTGEISASMLKELGCAYVILGHSERRTYFGEDDALVSTKAQAALAAGLIPIVCVGETLEERESGKTEAVIETQTRGSLAGISAEDLKKTVIAYEPVWAIGTGKVATTEQAQEVHAFIRGILADMTDEDTAQSVRIQYGGSMKPDNAPELLAQADIDGGLIGGAALKADAFTAIIEAAR